MELPKITGTSCEDPDISLVKLAACIKVLEKQAEDIRATLRRAETYYRDIDKKAA